MNIYLLTMTVLFNYLDVLKDHFKRKMNTIGTEIMEAVVNIFQMIIYYLFSRVAGAGTM